MPNTEKYLITSGIVGSKSEQDLDMSNISLTQTYYSTIYYERVHMFAGIFVQNIAEPLQSVVMSLQNVVMPLQNVAMSLQNVAMPLQSVAMSLQNVAMPLQNVAMPLQNVVTPTKY
jgi:hypothetical protein